MEFKFIEAEDDYSFPRRYVASLRLTNFRGHKDVEAHIFRYGYSESELAEIADLNLIGPPDPAMPAELVANATKEVALKCLLEAFTAEECHLLAAYLEEKYPDQIVSLYVAPLNLPAPLGVGPLAEIPESQSSGFIKLDSAPNYNLPFKVRAYYDLNVQ